MTPFSPAGGAHWRLLSERVRLEASAVRVFAFRCFALAAALAASAGCSPAGAECEPGRVYTCYPGPEGTLGVGDCRSGSFTCAATGRRTPCQGASVPEVELCDGVDNDCDGQTDEAVTNACGGCSILENQPGEACPPCGIFTCAGPENLS
jgi:hypothetical protein